jgi:HSP20 family molecular chaperone IbpA
MGMRLIIQGALFTIVVHIKQASEKDQAKKGLKSSTRAYKKFKKIFLTLFFLKEEDIKLMCVN